MNTVRFIPAIVLSSKSEIDQNSLIDVLVRLLKSQIPSELSVTKASLDKLAKEFPTAISRQIWAIVALNDDLFAQKVAISWILSAGRQLLSKNQDFAKSAVLNLPRLHSKQILARLLYFILSLPTLDGKSEESKAMLQDLLDGLLANSPTTVTLNDSNAIALSHINFLLPWVMQILNVGMILNFEVLIRFTYWYHC